MTDAKLLPGDPVLIVQPRLVRAVGFKPAMLLQQIHYETRRSELTWTDKARLQEIFPWWSEPTIRRALAGLERADMVSVEQVGRDRTKRYRVQIGAMDAITLTSERSDGSDQNGVVPISLKPKRGNNGEGKSARARVEDSFLR